MIAVAVEEDARPNPPASPLIGACYIVGPSPSGAWAGKSRCIAGFTSGGWRFIAPVEGLSAYVKASDMWASYRSGAWELGVLRGGSLVLDGVQVVGGRLAAIADPTGGATVDTEARAAIAQLLGAARQHGLIES